MNIKNKLDYNIKICELISIDLVSCECGKFNECKLSHNMSRVKDFLVAAQRDAIENMNDWADILSDELNLVNEIDQLNDEIKDLKLEIQGLDIENQTEKIQGDRCDSYIKGKEKLIKELKAKLNSKVKYTLENRTKFRNEFLEQVEEEIKDKKTKKKQSNLNFENIQSKSNFTESIGKAE